MTNLITENNQKTIIFNVELHIVLDCLNIPQMHRI